MASQDEGSNPKPPPKPAGPGAPRRTGSAFDLQPLASKPAPRSPSVTNLRAAQGPSRPELTPVTGRALSQTSARGFPPVLTKRPDALRKHLLTSGFDDEERTQIDAVLGHVQRIDHEPDEAPAGHGETYDGVTPADEVSSTDTWKAVNAPVQSRERRRSAQVLRTVIDQFAVGHNPRYTPESPTKPRAHVFVWDVSRAMSCEVPHFFAGREGSLSQTVDWVRREGPVNGWRRLDATTAAAAAEGGELVLAMPRDVRKCLVAVVRPGGLDPDGHPRVASANAMRGNNLGVLEVLARPIEYYGHR